MTEDRHRERAHAWLVPAARPSAFEDTVSSLAAEFAAAEAEGQAERDSLAAQVAALRDALEAFEFDWAGELVRGADELSTRRRAALTQARAAADAHDERIRQAEFERTREQAARVAAAAPKAPRVRRLESAIAAIRAMRREPEGA